MFKRIKKFFKRKDETDAVRDEIAAAHKMIIEDYNAFINAQIEYQDQVRAALEPFGEYLKKLEKMTAEERLEDSVIRAREAGLSEDKILHNMEEGERFFCS